MGTMKTSTFAANEQNKSTSLSTKQCPFKDGDHKIWMCTKFKQQGVNERYETLKEYKLCFCCLNAHLMKDLKSDRVWGVIGCTKKHNKLMHSDSPKPEKEIGGSLVSKQGRRFFNALKWLRLKRWLFVILDPRYHLWTKLWSTF